MARAAPAALELLMALAVRAVLAALELQVALAVPGSPVA